MPPQKAFTSVLQGQGSTVYSSQAHSSISTAVTLAQRASHIQSTLIKSILISTLLLLKCGRILNLHTQMDHYSNITLEGLMIKISPNMCHGRLPSTATPIDCTSRDPTKSYLDSHKQWRAIIKNCSHKGSQSTQQDSWCCYNIHYLSIGRIYNSVLLSSHLSQGI